jgi:hypothetical protein
MLFGKDFRVSAFASPSIMALASHHHATGLDRPALKAQTTRVVRVHEVHVAYRRALRHRLLDAAVALIVLEGCRCAFVRQA